MTDCFAEVSPAVVAANEAETLRREVLRRMEVYVLELLHTLLSLPIKGVFSSCNAGSAPQGEASGFSRQRIRGAAHAALPASTAALHDDLSAAPVSVPPGERASSKVSVSGCAGAVSSTRYGQPVTSRRTLHTVRHHLLVLSVLFHNVARGDVATQRDVYYHLVRHVPAQVVVNRTVQQLSRVLRLPREMMGVAAGGRGYIAGWISYRGVSLQRGGAGLAAGEGMPLPLLGEELVVSIQGITACASAGEEVCGVSGSWSSWSSTSCRSPPQSVSRCLTSTQHPEPANQSATNTAAPGFQVPSNVCAIVVVEKHAVFSQLLREGLPQLLPCVLLTAQGFPTNAARRLLANLSAALPRAAVVGLADYNPHGLAILAAYRWAATPDAVLAGSASMESLYYAVPTLRWLGARTAHIARAIGGREHGYANTGRSLVGRHPYPHSHTPTPLHQSVRLLKDAGSSNSAPSIESAAACALGCASFALDAEASAAGASPLTGAAPFQGFTHRDTVVMEHQIKRLEELLSSASSSPACGQSLDTDFGAADARNGNDVELRDATQTERISGALGAAHQGHPRLAVPDPAYQSDRASVAAWLNEAREMQRRKVKCEMEVLYTPPYAKQLLDTASVVHARGLGVQPPPSCFAEWICQQILRRQYI
ncbi:hypothetical protein JKF63_05268 [Porcisia hertigi]|uniref:DNA topoisomerase (ATP-hydrolyzing) n=1 Tax=Porcisia hertigi TaxID=2761500 RepID=A0A836INH9_9TRYP|nr:hypothetical protein JKF63_05268 [Porcisia hertigi]